MDFDTSKLKTTFIYPATPSSPIDDRKYTLTHSDTTGMMFLDIGNEYNYSAIDEKLRDELIGKWKSSDDNSYKLIFYAFVGDFDLQTASKRYNIFKSHLNSALHAVIYGDRYLFNNSPELTTTPIYVKFDCIFPMFDNYEFYGYVNDYML